MQQYFWEHLPAERRLFRTEEVIHQTFGSYAVIIGFDVNNFGEPVFIDGKYKMLPQLNQLPSITTIPVNARSFYSYLGTEGYGYVQDLLAANTAAQLQKIAIGWQDENKKYLRTVELNFDYSPITALLSQYSFPALHYLNLGIDEIFANQSMMLGDLGDITMLLNNTPVLEILNLFGGFSLHKPVRLPQLKQLQIETVGYYIHESSISDQTMQHLWQSDMPMLEELYVNVNFEGIEDKIYTIDETFFDRCPSLKKVQIVGTFQKGTKQKILEKLSGKIQLFLNDISE